MTENSDPLNPPDLGPDDDGREMCFSQGKPCVYQSETDPNKIITEWPNGVVEELDLTTEIVIRTWPDKTTETFPRNSPENARYPHIAETRK